MNFFESVNLYKEDLEENLKEIEEAIKIIVYGEVALKSYENYRIKHGLEELEKDKKIIKERLKNERYIKIPRKC